MSGIKSDFTTKYSPPISLGDSKQYEAALLSIDLFNSIPNITNSNNVLRYSKDDGKSWLNIELDPGSYELSAMNNKIQRLMAINGEYDHTADNSYFITNTANLSELKSIVHISNNSYKIDFSVPNSNGSVLGFSNEIIGLGYNESPNISNIIQVNSVLVIPGSYVNGSASPTIYSFYSNVSPGYKIVEKPSPSLVFYPVSRNEITPMRVWLTDQNNDSIDLGGEQITMRICMRAEKNVILILFVPSRLSSRTRSNNYLSSLFVFIIYNASEQKLLWAF